MTGSCRLFKMRVFILILMFSLNCLSCVLSQEAAKKICIKDACVQAEIADTEAARQLGLMFRENLPEGRGMLFIFDYEAPYNFWMKNTSLPLDIIWIDKDKRVVDVKTNVQPCEETRESFERGSREKSCESISPRDKALYVLEVNSGFAKKNNLTIGDKVDFQVGSGENP